LINPQFLPLFLVWKLRAGLQDVSENLGDAFGPAAVNRARVAGEAALGPAGRLPARRKPERPQAGAVRIPMTRERVVVMSRRFDDEAPSLAAEIARRLQIVADPGAPAGLALVEAPQHRRRMVPLMGDVADRLDRVSAERGVAPDVLVDAALTAWLDGSDPSTGHGQPQS
jgi:hypothetical protein